MPAEQLVGGEAIADLRGERTQHAVAGGVTVQFVDLLEVVDVDVEHGGTLLASRRGRQCLLDVPLQLAAIGQPGERVVLGQVDHLQRQRAGFADVVEHQDATDDIVGVVVDRRRRILHRGVEAVAMPQQGLAGQIDDGVVFDRHAQRVGDGVAGLGVEELEDLLDRTALRFAAGPAGHRLGDRVERGDAQLRIGGDHRVADRAQGHFGEFALAVQRVLERLALADVLRLRHEVARRAVFVAHHRHAQLQVHGVAVLVEIALLQLIGVAPAAEHLCHQLHVDGQIVGMGDRGDVQLEQLALAIAEHPANRRIDAQEATIGMDQRHADGGMLERAEEALFALVQLQLQGAPLGDVDQCGEYAAHATVGVEVGLEIAVRVAPLVTVVQLALVAGRMPRIGLFQRRPRALVIAMADHVDQALAEQRLRLDAEPRAMRLVGVAKALLIVEVGKQYRRTFQYPRRPVRRGQGRWWQLGRLVRAHDRSVSLAPPSAPPQHAPSFGRCTDPCQSTGGRISASMQQGDRGAEFAVVVQHDPPQRMQFAGYAMALGQQCQ